jgi:hypothetical protein
MVVCREANNLAAYGFPSVQSTINAMDEQMNLTGDVPDNMLELASLLTEKGLAEYEGILKENGFDDL